MLIKGDAVIYPVDNDRNRLFCRIIDVSMGVAWVEIARNHRLRKADTIVILAYDEVRGMLLYKGVINEIDSNKAVICGLNLIDEKQRRSDVRVKFNIKMTLDEVHAGGKIKKMGNSVSLETLDLSAGGVLVKTKFFIAEENACLCFKLPLITKSIQCKAQIMRRKAEDNYFLYGCRFLNNENEKTELRRFIFMKQIEYRKSILLDISAS